MSAFSVLTPLQPEHPQGCSLLLMPGTIVQAVFTSMFTCTFNTTPPQ